MTAHQDVAGVVAECLRPDGIMPVNSETTRQLTQAVISLSKALSEAEAERDRLSKRIDLLAVGFNVPDGGRYIADWQTKITKFKSAESRLAEAMKVIGPFASRDMSDINDCVDNYDMRYQSQWFADATAAARRFLNAGKE